MNKFPLLLFLTLIITCCGNEIEKRKTPEYSFPNSNLYKEKTSNTNTPLKAQIKSKFYDENELPKLLKVKSEVLYKTQHYNDMAKEIVSEELVLIRVQSDYHDGYAVRIDDKSLGKIFDLVPQLDLSQINFSKLNKVEQYIELFGKFNDITDAWGDEERMHSSNSIYKIVMMDGKPIGISIFLHFSKGKNQKDTDVDEAIVKIFK